MRLLNPSQTSTVQPLRFGNGFKQVHPKLYGACDYLSTLGLKLIHVSKGFPGNKMVLIFGLLCVCHTLITSSTCALCNVPNNDTGAGLNSWLPMPILTMGSRYDGSDLWLGLLDTNLLLWRNYVDRVCHQSLFLDISNPKSIWFPGLIECRESPSYSQPTPLRISDPLYSPSVLGMYHE